MTPALRTDGLSKHFGAFKAKSDITLAFPHGARHALIGPNGAGKTTLINLLTGVLAADRRATCSSATSASPGSPQHERVKRGMTRTFQINTLFAGPHRARVGRCSRSASARGAPASGTAPWRGSADEVDEALALLAIAASRRRGRTR